MLQEALAYAAEGIPVFPCEPKSKAPIGLLAPNGFYDATTDPELITEWWAIEPKANIAMPTGVNGMFDVLDIDVRSNGNGWEAYQRIRDLVGSRYERKVSTPSGGLHVYFPAGGQRSGMLRDVFIDFKANGGYVLLPPSYVVNADDGYEGTYAENESAFGGEPLDWQAVKDRLEPKTFREKRAIDGPVSAPGDPSATRYADAALAGEVTNIRNAVPNHNRNIAVNTAAFNMGSLVAAGHIDERQVEGALRDAALATGLPGREVDKTIPRAMADGAAKVGPREVKLTQRQPLQVVVPDSESVESFWSQHDVLQHIHDFALSRLMSPWAVLGVTLVRVMACVDYAVALPPIIGGKASLNLFVGIVAPSGIGKGGAIQTAHDALTITGLNRDGTVMEIDTRKIGTGQGIAHAYGYWDRSNNQVVRMNYSIVFTADEVDHLLAHSNMTGSTVLSELRSLFMGERLGAMYADPTRRVEIKPHEYRAGLILGIQPAKAKVLLDDADGGTPQRFLWVPGGYPLPETDPDEVAPRVWKIPNLKHGALDVCDTARDAIRASHRARMRGDGDPLDGHRLLLKEKVAAALSFLCGGAAITEKAWAMAETVMQVSDGARWQCQGAIRLKAMAANTARAQNEADRAVVVNVRLEDEVMKRARRAIMRALDPGEWMAHSELRNSKLSSKLREHFEDVIGDLIETGLVEKQGSKRGVMYRKVPKS